LYEKERFYIFNIAGGVCGVVENRMRQYIFLNKL
jgi:hypothetical protein